MTIDHLTTDHLFFLSNKLLKRKVQSDIFLHFALFFGKVELNQKQVVSGQVVSLYNNLIKKKYKLVYHYRSIRQPILNVFFNSVKLNIFVLPFSVCFPLDIP